MARRARVLAIACFVLATPCGASASSTAQGFSDALELARAGRVHDALATARSIPDPLAAAQAEVHVRWAGGDLVGALASGEVAIERFPSDLYLLEQCGQLAAALGASEKATAHSEALDAALRASTLSDEERKTWQARATALREEALAAETRMHERSRALTRAHWTVLGAGSFVLFALVLPWRLLARRA
jgi:hypothetical protein